MVKSRRPPYRKYITILSLALAGFSVLFVSIMLKGVAFNILTQLDNTFYAQFLLIRERLKEDKKTTYSDVVIVGIDDRTLNKLGAYNPLKYRRYHINLLENILKGQPSAVVYDILFGDPHDDPEVDRKLSLTMKKGPVFSVCFGSNYDRSGGMFEPFAYKVPEGLSMKLASENGFELMSSVVLGSLKSVGLANAYPDNDGLLRKMPIFFKVKGGLYPTIALEVFRKTRGIPSGEILIKNGRIEAGGTVIPVDGHCRAYINIDKTHRIREMSFYDVWAGRVPGRFFHDKIVFIAAAATGLGDNKLVPLYGYISGVKIHANLFLNMVYKNFIYEVSGKNYYVLIFFASFFYTFLFYSRRELSLIKRLMDYISTESLVTMFGNALIKMPLADRIYKTFRSKFNRSYALSLFFLLFSEARRRIQPILFQLVLLYFALFLIFYYFNVFIKPSALLIQVFICYVIVSEFKRIDFSKIAPYRANS
jgi:CHASE2 domain-containing sensor protein